MRRLWEHVHESSLPFLPLFRQYVGLMGCATSKEPPSPEPAPIKLASTMDVVLVDPTPPEESALAAAAVLKAPPEAVTAAQVDVKLTSVTDVVLVDAHSAERALAHTAAASGCPYHHAWAAPAASSPPETSPPAATEPEPVATDAVHERIIGMAEGESVLKSSVKSSKPIVAKSEDEPVLKSFVLSSTSVAEPEAVLCPVAKSVTPDDWPRAPPGASFKKLGFTREQKNVDELLVANAAAIATLREALADTDLSKYDPGSRVPYDDIWLLRFILSNGTQDAEKAVRATLAYRAANVELLERAACGDNTKYQPLLRYSIAQVYSQRTTMDEPVQLIRAGKSNVKKLMDLFTEDEVVESMNFQKEQLFLMCDEATRRTRRLVKMVTCLDMHSSKFTDNDKRFFKALGRASKDSELYYPQLLQITVAINVPSYLNLIWPIAKRVMPAKTLAKFRICSARNTLTESAVKCPFATTAFTPECASRSCLDCPSVFQTPGAVALTSRSSHRGPTRISRVATSRSTLVNFLGGSGPSTEVLGPADRPRVAYDENEAF